MLHVSVGDAEEFHLTQMIKFLIILLYLKANTARMCTRECYNFYFNEINGRMMFD